MNGPPKIKQYNISTLWCRDTPYAPNHPHPTTCMCRDTHTSDLQWDSVGGEAGNDRLLSGA